MDDAELQGYLDKAKEALDKASELAVELNGVVEDAKLKFDELRAKLDSRAEG